MVDKRSGDGGDGAGAAAASPSAQHSDKRPKLETAETVQEQSAEPSKKKGRGKFGKGKKAGWDADKGASKRDGGGGGEPGARGAGYVDLSGLRNRSFELFYQTQGLVGPEDWQAFMMSLREPLPTALRIHGDCPYKDQ
jgi:hypothetical protein